MTRVMIVDDEKENRDALRIALSDQNPDWDILTACGENDCIVHLQEACKTNKPIDVRVCPETRHSFTEPSDHHAN